MNTNWIDRADPAIKRSQRFDSAIFVLPPSFARKKAELAGVLSTECEASLTRDVVEAALQGTTGGDFGWFALMRYDQLVQLRAALATYDGGATTEDLRRELTIIGTELAGSDWMPAPPREGEKSREPFENYRELASAQRRDFARRRYLRIEGCVRTVPEEYSIAGGDEAVTFLRIPSGIAVPSVVLATEEWRAERNELLWYRLLPSTVKDEGPGQR